jgi:hypothetical protein
MRNPHLRRDTQANTIIMWVSSIMLAVMGATLWLITP